MLRIRPEIIVAAAIAGAAIASQLISAPLHAAAQQKRSTWDGVFSDAQSERGKAVYDDQCAECHGVDLNGVDFTPPLAGAVFEANWDTLPVGTLFERGRVTMPLNRENSLSRQQYTDIVAYVLLKNGFPSGEAELPTQLEELNQITFLATKP
jgi:mono/diheme cytochrome c family protein